MERAGHSPCAVNLAWTDRAAGLGSDDLEMISRQTKRRPEGNVVALHLYVPHPRQPSLAGAVNVARAMFETDRLPGGWDELLLARDEIWVPCHHNREVFVRGGLPEHAIRVVGETIDFDLFTPTGNPLDLPDAPDGAIRFLVNFDFSERKGWKPLLRAWAQAFDPDDPVCLILKASSMYKDGDWVRRRIEGFVKTEFGGSRGLAPLVLYTDFLDANDMPRLYEAADVYVSASRGEAWGRPYMEAMAMGLPTIGSGWGGNTDFMDPTDSWLIEGKLIDVDPNAELFNDLYYGHRWFDADSEHLAAIFREIAADLPAARAKAAPARQRLIDHWGDEAMAATLQDACAQAWERCDPNRPVTVAIRGSFGAGSSLAAVNEQLSASLEAAGHHVAYLHPDYAVSGRHAPAINHHWPPRFLASSLGRTVTILPWEYGAAPQPWVDNALRYSDEIWVPSQYVKDGFVASGMPEDLVRVIPNGVDTTVFTPQGDRYPLPSAGTTFLFVGGTIWRKGIDLLLEAWQQAFGPDEDVQLVIKDFGSQDQYAGQTATEQITQLCERDDVAPVLHLDAQWDYRQLPSLYRAADVLVAPYRGEGFGLPMLEAMACGVPVIHTGVGPSREFVADAGWALDAHRVPLPDGSELPWPLAGDGYAHEVSVEDLAAALRAAADPDARRLRASAARPQAERYRWDLVAAQAARALEDLDRQPWPPVRSITPTSVNGHPTKVVLCPDWDQHNWRAPLAAWFHCVAADAPVTLILAVAENDAQHVIDQVLAVAAQEGISEDQLPDLTVAHPGRGGIISLLAGADGVLLCPDDERPEVSFRARARLRGPDDIRSFLARCGLQ